MKKTPCALIILLAAGTAVLAEQPRAPSQAEADQGSDSFVFQLLPNSLNKNPRLQMSFVTEMSDAGRKLPPPSPTQPVYYLAQAGGYRQIGDGASVGEQVPPPADMQKLMQDALTKAGYLPADAAHPATLVVIFHWGSYTTPPETPDAPPIPVEIKNHQILERAALVGGEKYSRALEQALVEASALADTKAPSRPNAVTGEPVADNVFGNATGSFSDAFDPIAMFLAKTPKNRELYDLATGSCYYVIASGYDAAAAAKKQKLLLWRTKMSVAADGVSLAETVSPMVSRSSRYLGKETDGAVTLSRRIHEGRVDLGELKIMGEADKLSTPEPKK